VLLLSVPVLILCSVAFLVTLGLEKHQSRLKSVREISVAIGLAVLAANVLGDPLREAGARDRMDWGVRLAGILEDYRREKGRFPESLEELKGWGRGGVPSLSGGGRVGYERDASGGYELRLYMGHVEAYVRTDRDREWVKVHSW
jgi:hypothetical protein